jgi:hypothetical protein
MSFVLKGEFSIVRWEEAAIYKYMPPESEEGDRNISRNINTCL